MARTLNELTRDLRDYLIEMQSDAYNSSGFKKYRYNNLKIEIADPRIIKEPQVVISIGMSEATFNIMNNEKISGGLGPDERFVIKWFERSSNREELKAAHARAERQVGKAQAAE